MNLRQKNKILKRELEKIKIEKEIERKKAAICYNKYLAWKELDFDKMMSLPEELQRDAIDHAKESIASSKEVKNKIMENSKFNIIIDSTKKLYKIEMRMALVKWGDKN